MKDSILSINNLTVTLRNDQQTKILHNVSLDVPSGRIVGIVGSSGSGKTTIGMAVLGLLPVAMVCTRGKIVFKGEDITGWDQSRLRRWRGRSVGMVFQEPASAFDPLFTVGDQIRETVQMHMKESLRENQNLVMDILRQAGVADPQRVSTSYPHELSGGLRQRVMIAQAICCRPALVIADEPTSSLDVSLQAHIIELFKDLRKNLGLSMVIISHDLGMVRHLADEVVILHQGRIVEKGSTEQVMKQAKDPHARRLIHAEDL